MKLKQIQLWLNVLLSPLVTHLVKPPVSCGAELATIHVIIFQKLVAYPGQWQTWSGGPDQIQVSKQKIINSPTNSYFETFQLFLFITKWNPWTSVTNPGQ